MTETTPADSESRPQSAADRTIGLAIDGLNSLSAALRNGLNEPFCAAVSKILATDGTVAVTGMGKSGHIARKAAATLASTGTPSLYVHPAEASHGDLGMIHSGDCVLAFSWSGETEELHAVLSHAARKKIPIIAVTSRPESTLARAADILLAIPRTPEACSEVHAPTTSTTLQMVLADALAVALIEARGFTAGDFQSLHPGGALGKALLPVSAVMHKGDALPFVDLDTPMTEALITMSGKGLGTLIVRDGEGNLAGIITDGDIRRAVLRDGFLDLHAGEVMTASPRTISPDMLAVSAVDVMENRITALIVTEGDRPVGLLQIHNLTQAGLI